jgi:ribose 5-phosphate isomerase A
MAGASKAGPCITDHGLMVVDVDFGAGAGLAAAGFTPRKLHEALKLVCGVVETGLFAGLASRAYVGNEDGSVSVFDRQE